MPIHPGQRADQAHPGAGRADGTSAPVTTKRILIVDDDPHNVAILQRTLQGYFACEATCDGSMALRILSEEGPFDLVLTDERMPQMDGFKLSHAIRSGCTSKGTSGTPSTVPIIMLAADPRSWFEAELAREDVRYISKPIRPRELAEMIVVEIGGG
ncbi:MAG: response regulator [Candidatus Binatia bacterium]